MTDMEKAFRLALLEEKTRDNPPVKYIHGLAIKLLDTIDVEAKKELDEILKKEEEEKKKAEEEAKAAQPKVVPNTSPDDDDPRRRW
jgi:hypothetical protein